jgi:hypothetical protein
MNSGLAGSQTQAQVTELCDKFNELLAALNT